MGCGASSVAAADRGALAADTCDKYATGSDEQLNDDRPPPIDTDIDAAASDAHSVVDSRGSSSDGSCCAEPGTLRMRARIMGHIVAARILHGIDGTVSTRGGTESPPEPAADVARSCARARSWVDACHEHDARMRSGSPALSPEVLRLENVPSTVSYSGLTAPLDAPGSPTGQGAHRNAVRRVSSLMLPSPELPPQRGPQVALWDVTSPAGASSVGEALLSTTQSSVVLHMTEASAASFPVGWDASVSESVTADGDEPDVSSPVAAPRVRLTGAILDAHTANLRRRETMRLAAARRRQPSSSTLTSPGPVGPRALLALRRGSSAAPVAVEL